MALGTWWGTVQAGPRAGWLVAAPARAAALPPPREPVSPLSGAGRHRAVQVHLKSAGFKASC